MRPVRHKHLLQSAELDSIFNDVVLEGGGSMLIQWLVVVYQIVFLGVLVRLLNVCKEDLFIVSGWTTLVLGFINCI
jgi:hypothetical protein